MARMAPFFTSSSTAPARTHFGRPLQVGAAAAEDRMDGGTQRRITPSADLTVA